MEKKKLISKDQLRQFIKENHLKSAVDAQDMLRDLFSEEAELDYSLGYQKSDEEQADQQSRNGHSKKTVRSEYGETEDYHTPRPSTRKPDFFNHVIILKIAL